MNSVRNLCCISICLGLALTAASVNAQVTPPKDAREAAPVDLTGTWVSVVTEDWRWRMVTPAKGDFGSVPLNDAGKKVGLEWDPAKDEAAGEQCKAYGAAAIMRTPGRVRIKWQDGDTLRLETDAGQQVRLFRFKPAAGAASQPAAPSLPGTAMQAAPISAADPPSWQGYSVAEWEREAAMPPPVSPPPGWKPPPTRLTGSLKVSTTGLRPGYFYKNGLPYSAQTTVTEYYDYRQEPSGDQRFTVVTIVTDPQYLTSRFITSSDFKREKDDTKWQPMPCTAR